MSSFSVTGFSVVDIPGSKVEIASVIKSKILGVLVSSGSSVTNVVTASLPRGSGYMNSPSAGAVVSILSVTRESESGILAGGAVWVTISGTILEVGSVEVSAVSAKVVFSVITWDCPSVVMVTPVAVSVASISVETSEEVANVVILASTVDDSGTASDGGTSVVPSVLNVDAFSVAVIMASVEVSPTISSVVPSMPGATSDGFAVVVIGTASVEVLVVSITIVVSTSVGTAVVITSAIEVSIESVVISASDAISNMSSVVVSPMTISEGFKVVEGKLSVVDIIETSPRVDISVRISDGRVVVTISPIDVSVVMSGSTRDSDGKIVVIVSVVWALVVVVINEVLWSCVVEVMDVVSNSPTSVVEGGNVLSRMASVVVLFMSTFIVVLSVTIWDDSDDVEI